jgi:hypothetical protein
VRATLLLLLAACARPQPHAQPADPCAATDWRAFTDRSIELLLTPLIERDGRRYFDRATLAANAREIDTTIARCRAPVPANLARFAAAVGRSAVPGHDAGYAVPDRAWLAHAGPAIELPPLLRSAEFLAAIAAPATYGDALAMIDARNQAAAPGDRWATLLYRSRFLATPDRSVYGRLLIHVPGEPTEQWIQFGIIAPGDRAAPADVHGVSMVAVTRRADGSRESFVVDFWREARASGVMSIEPNIAIDQGTSACHDCHKSALLPVRPDRVLQLDAAGRLTGAKNAPLIAEVDRAIAAVGAPAYGGLLDPSAFGPPLGPTDRARSDAELAACAAPLAPAPAALARLRDAMGCAACHDGRRLGAINFPQAVPSHLDLDALLHPDTRRSMPLVASYVTEGWMPPGAALTAGERAALLRCLTREYWDERDRSGLLADWLRDR